MYSTSDAYKAAIVSSARQTRITGKIYLPDSTEIDISNDNLIQRSLSLAEQCVSGDNIEIGNVYAAELNLSIATPEDPYAIANSRIEPYFGILREDKGVFENNLAIDGDFPTGSTAWTPAGATMECIDGVAKIYGNGASLYPQFSQNTGVPVVPNAKYYCRFTFKSTIEVPTFVVGSWTAFTIGGTSGGSVNFNVGGSPHYNQVYERSAILTMPSDAVGNLQIRFQYYITSQQYATGQVYEMRDIVVINLTSVYGAGNEPTKEELDELWENPQQVWEDIPLGVYYAAEVRRKNKYITIKAYDGMILLDEPLPGGIIQGTPYELISLACSTCDVPLAAPKAVIDALPNGNLSMLVPPNSPIKTCRDLIMWVCDATATFARMSRTGALEICRLHSAPVRTVTANERRPRTTVSDSVTKVTKVEMEINGGYYSVGTDAGMTLTLNSNPLLQTRSASEITAALTAILNEITQAEYTPFQIDIIGDPSLQPGDYITLAGVAGGVNKVGLITHSNWHYRGKHILKGAGKEEVIQSSVRSQTEKTVESISTRQSKTEKDLADLAGNLGDLAWEDAVEASKLGETIIQGGYIVTNLLNADRIKTGRLDAERIYVGSGSGFEPGYNPKTDLGVFLENFEMLPDKWTVPFGDGTLSIVSSGETGGKALRFNGFKWLVYPTNIPFDPSKLYRIKARVRQISDPSAGTKRIYIGVTGIAADGTTRVNINGENSYSAQHYVCASDQSLTANSQWVEYVGYFQGHGTIKANAWDISSPSGLHANVRYFRPMVALNYDATAGGVAEIDTLSVEIVSADIASAIVNGTWKGGTFINENIIYSPIIAGNDGIFRGTLRIGDDGGILVDGPNKRIYIDPYNYLDTTGIYMSAAHIKGTIQAHQIILGSDTTYENGYNPVQGWLYVRGTGHNRIANRMLRLNNQQIYNAGGRGLRLTVIRRSDLAVTFDQNYDTYNSNQARIDLTDKLNSLSDEVIVVLASYDGNRITNYTALMNAIKRCGGSGVPIGTNAGDVHFQTPYVLVGIPGIGQGAGLEVYTSADANAPYAEITTRIVDGTPQGIDTRTNSIVSQILNGTYTGGTFINGTMIYSPSIIGGNIQGINITGTSTITGATIRTGTGNDRIELSGSTLKSYASNGITAVKRVELTTTELAFYDSSGALVGRLTGTENKSRIPAKSVWGASIAYLTYDLSNTIAPQQTIVFSVTGTFAFFPNIRATGINQLRVPLAGSGGPSFAVYNPSTTTSITTSGTWYYLDPTAPS